MNFNQKIKTSVISDGGISFEFLETGDIANIRQGMTLVNQLAGNNIEGSVSNLYLRLYEEGSWAYTKMIGVDSPSAFSLERNKAVYRGRFKSVDYSVILHLVKNTWFWDIRLFNRGGQPLTADVIYGQDVAIADTFAVRNNEAYVSQYLDHRIFQDEHGYTVCTRQNQGVPHFLQEGSLTKNVGYSTDGFQFFGLSYKDTNIPEVLMNAHLENRNYQYEFAYTALQSEACELGGEVQIVFYGLYADSIYEVAEGVRFLPEITAAWEALDKDHPQISGHKVERRLHFEKFLTVAPFTTAEIEKRYPKRRHEEQNGENLLSFFQPDSSHVVLKDKELCTERPHGHLLLSGDKSFIQDELLCSTNYMFGVFSSHIAIGNVNFHKFTTGVRNPLNVRKLSGQRLFVEIDGAYQLLSLPSVYECGLDYAKWLYKLKDDVLCVRTQVDRNLPQLSFDVRSEQGKAYNFIVTNNIILGPNENEWPFTAERFENSVDFIPSEKAMSHDKYPGLKYRLNLSCDFEIRDDGLFFEDGLSRGEPLINLMIPFKSSFQIIVQGLINGEPAETNMGRPADVQPFHISIDNEAKEEIDKFNDTFHWYSHNALIHYAAPHGLEQYNGAAWGTRDVCQGPAEYFLSIQRFDVVRDILLKVYSRQFKQNGDWPQWFMFDKYYQIQAHESHGDIIVWPLRTLGLYLKATGDTSILNEKTPFTDLEHSEFTKETATVLEHVLYQIETIENSFLPGTHLSCYGGGDWDDTLQPANKELTKRMVSGWTVALTYETFTLMADELARHEPAVSERLKTLAEAIKTDYYTYVMKDHIPAGFLLFQTDGVKHMLHPRDEDTGIKYRLLPFNRGIISGLFAPEETEEYCSIIDEYLKYPDGIRLMDTPVNYKGGINTIFTRAETAANFGREIGLQYVHASIRYIEAMAKLGKAEEVWKYLSVLNPINIQEAVPNAHRRQSNLYFSSSDGAFYDRYEAKQDYGKLKTGAIGVKGGWRLYSSGPGIYLNQLITNVLGIQVVHNELVIDPVLPKRLDGLKLEFAFKGVPFEVTYHVENREHLKMTVNGREVICDELKNKYRRGGAVIPSSELRSDYNKLEVFM